ncbi:Outer dense fiber protein 2, partial [Lemmus lemmus]
MSKLVEAEMDGAAAAKQVMALKDTAGKLKTLGGALGLGETDDLHRHQHRDEAEGTSPAEAE